MTSTTATTTSDLPTVKEFLQQCQTEYASCHSMNDGKKGRRHHFALGNPAGDADSIISAIAVAYINSVFHDDDDSMITTIPIISIPKEDLLSQRPETKYLLQLAQIIDDQNDNDLFLAMDDPHLTQQKEALVTLVDHNQLTLNNNNNNNYDNQDWKVVEIWDHHFDEGAHLDTCPPSTTTTTTTHNPRNIAFDSSTSSALVASTCTLMVERMSQQHQLQQSFPPTLSIMLLGVILLDSINMLPQAGKGTPRDAAAIELLQTRTNWDALPLPAELLENKRIETTKLFDTLQSQKFHPEFWNSLTAYQALKLDYKSFDAPTITMAKKFGVSTILQTQADFWNKAGVLQAIQEHYADMDFFGCMFFSTPADGGAPHRELSLVSSNRDLLDSLVEFLIQGDGDTKKDDDDDDNVSVSLQAQVVQRYTESHDDGEQHPSWHIVHMSQGNSKASRKQVVPIFMEYYRQQERESSKL